MSVETIRVPDMGSEDAADVIEIPVQAGDTIAAEDTIAVVESDKATIEIPASGGGRILRVLISEGDSIRNGDPVLEVETSDETSTGDTNEDATEAETRDAGMPSKSEGEQGAQPQQPEPPSAEAAPETASGGDFATRRLPVEVPDLGDIEKAEIIELPVQQGDSVEAEQTIAVLESDKASLEIPAPAAGGVVAVRVSSGDSVRSGDVLLELAVYGEAGEQQAAPTGTEPQGRNDGNGQSREPARDGAASAGAQNDEGKQDLSESLSQIAPSGRVHAGPAVRKLARKLGVDLAEVSGTGPRQRIVKEDLYAHVNRRLRETPAASAGMASSVELPDIDFSRFGETERVELNKLRRVSASNLHRSWLTIPHVTQHDEADITGLEAFRKEQNGRLEGEGVKLTMLAFLVKASTVALQHFPDFNSSLEKSGEALIRKHYFHIGVAVDTPDGLMVPVVRDADSKGVIEIAEEVGELARKARSKKLMPGDMQGGTFSISSLGGIGGTAFTPIVNWPEVAILGASRARTAPHWNGREFEPRLMLPLSLSYDHRVIDGASAARFTRFIAETLEDLRRALL